MSIMPYSQERILEWAAYPLSSLDQKVLSRLADCDDIIRGSHFSALSRIPQPLIHHRI